MPGLLSGRISLPQNLHGLQVEPAPEARSPSGKAKVCKTFIGGSIPPRASKATVFTARIAK